MAEYQVQSSEPLVMFCELDSHAQVNSDATRDDVEARILKYCEVPRTKKEIVTNMGYSDEHGFTKRHLKFTHIMNQYF